MDPDQPNTQTDITQEPPSEEVPQASGDASPHPRQGLHDTLSIVAVFVAALVLAWALISFVFQSYEVNGPSMETTLQNNDHLVVWKVARTWARITGHPYVPARGDIVIFHEPGLAEYGQGNDK